MPAHRAALKRAAYLPTKGELAMTTVTLENIWQQVEQLPPVAQLKLARLIEERQAQPRKPPRDKRVPCEP